MMQRDLVLFFHYIIYFWKESSAIGKLEQIFVHSFLRIQFVRCSRTTLMELLELVTLVSIGRWILSANAK